LYDYLVTTPANTTKASPTRTDLPLRRGMIDQVQIAFPPGPMGLLHVVIERGGSPLWPANVGAGFASDNFTIVFNPLYELVAAPLALTAVSWNEDDSYSHQVAIRVNVVPAHLYYPDRQELGILQRLERILLGRRG